MTEAVVEILRAGESRSLSITPPSHVSKFYANIPTEKDMDETHMLPTIRANITEIDKPILAFMGAYSSGKTFLIRHLLGTTLLKSHIRPETAVVTVLRHLSDRPASWPKDCQVFVLVNGADPRTLDFKNVVDSGTYDDLERFTTYSGGAENDVVLVFLESGELADKIILDCPGVGTLAEAVHEVSETILSSQKQTIRERELQSIAMRCADGFVVLSGLVGGGGAFSDSNTGQVLGELAKHVGRFPMKIPHANVLLVGSQADPRKEDLRNEREVLDVARAALLKQCESLPNYLLANLEPAGLINRVVTFFALDQSEVESAEADIARTLKRSNPATPADALRAEASRQFSENRRDRERTQAFEAAFTTMTGQMQLQMESFRNKVALEKLEASITHFEGRQLAALQKAQAQAEMEDLSRQYTAQRRDRDKVWSTLTEVPSARFANARRGAFTEFQNLFSNFENKDYVRSFLTNHYASKEQARDHAPGLIQETIQEGLQRALLSGVTSVESATIADLSDFDAKFLRRSGSSLDPLGLGQDSNAELKIGGLQTVSATATFTAITYGIAGGTTILATAGVGLAQAALVKVLAIGVGALGTVGLGGAATGLLLGIPIYGWLALGMFGIVAAAWKLFKSWDSSMADAIVKSVKKNRAGAESQARTVIDSYLDAAKSILDESLRKTKEVIDGHIAEVHEIAKGIVTSDDLRSAARFYGEHVEVLRETRARLEAA